MIQYQVKKLINQKRDNEALLKKTEITMEENDVMKKLNLS